MVFKMFEGDSCERLYNAELDIYRRIVDTGNNSITTCYGCFSYEETRRRIIILEFARGGSLLDFLGTTRQPATPAESQKLWEQLLDLLDGLHTLHNLGTGSGSSNCPTTV